MTGWTRACSSTQGCIEAATTGPGTVTLRTTREPSHTIATTREEFAEFLAAAKNGEYDHLTQEQP